MVEHILGNYLVESGKITKEQLAAVLEQMNAVRVKLGLIAVSEGFMTREQAEAVNKLQAVCDKRFGDIAVEQGYLTNEQVSKLLAEQGNSYFMFVQTLVDLFLIEADEMDFILEGFRKAKGYTNSELEDIKSDDIDRIVRLYIPTEAEKYQEIVNVALRTIVRLVDRRVSLDTVSVDKTGSVSAMVVQALDGREGFSVMLSEADGALLKICSVFGQEDFSELDDDALDAACEFLNCLNGLYVSGRSREGQFLELLPPQLYVGGRVLKSGAVCKVPVYIADKKLELIVAEPA